MRCPSVGESIPSGYRSGEGCCSTVSVYAARIRRHRPRVQQQHPHIDTGGLFLEQLSLWRYQLPTFPYSHNPHTKCPSNTPADATR